MSRGRGDELSFERERKNCVSKSEFHRRPSSPRKEEMTASRPPVRRRLGILASNLGREWFWERKSRLEPTIYTLLETIFQELERDAR